jgi:RecA-family ATPase
MNRDNATKEPISSRFQAWLDRQGDLSDLDFGEREPDLIEGVVPSGNIVFVTGQPKEGKSLLVQHWAHSVATGTDWQGHEARQGTVFYLYPDGEHPRYLAERINALEIDSGVAVDYKTRLRYRDSFNFSLAEDRENILEGLVDSNLRLVIIDTIAAATPGKDLNSAKDISELNLFAKEITKRSNGMTTVVIVAHSTKGNTQTVSGSIQLQANASVTYSMKKTETSAGDIYHLRTIEARHTGNKFAMTFKPKEVQLGVSSKSIVLVSNTQENSKPELIAKRFSGVLHDQPKDEWIPQAPLVKQLMALHSIGDSTAYRWLDEALRHGLFESDGSGPSKRLRIPNPQQSPMTPSGNYTQSPPSPQLFRVGNGEEEELF